MTERDLRKMSYEELIELAEMAKAEAERRATAEQRKAWGKVTDAITNYISNFGSIEIDLPEDVSNMNATSENLFLSQPGMLELREEY